MKKLRGVLAVCGTCLIYFAMGLYFSSGNTAVYLTSYLRFYADSKAELSDSIWFLATVGLSAVLLPVGGLLDNMFGVRACVLLGALMQSMGILTTYFALDTNFVWVVTCYGGGFMMCFAVSYTPVLANINKWFPLRKGLVTGIVAAAMAAAPTVWTPLVTSFVNPRNVAPDPQGYFNDVEVLQRTRLSLLLQGCVTMVLFLVGISILFPAPRGDKLSDDSDYKDYKDYEKKGDLGKKALSFGNDWDEGLSPRQVLKMKEFYLLSLKIMLTELVFFYLLFVYKPFGQTFIMNDFFLSAIGAFAAISNTLCRLVVGHLKDLTTYKVCCIPLSALATLLVISLPLTSTLHRMFYGVWVVAAVGVVGSQYALMPSAVTEAFGEKYASINIGLVYASTVIADVLGAVGSQLLTEPLGWSGIIAIVGSCAFVDFLATFFLPNDPKKRLEKLLLKYQAAPRIPSISSVVKPVEMNGDASAYRRTSLPKSPPSSENSETPDTFTPSIPCESTRL